METLPAVAFVWRVKAREEWEFGNASLPDHLREHVSTG